MATKRNHDWPVPANSSSRTRPTERATSMSTNAKRKRVANTEPNDSTTPTKRARRWKNTAAISSGSVDVVDLTYDEPTGSSPVKKKQRTPKTKKSAVEATPEKRARVFRNHPPKTFLERKHRATTQRMFVVGNTVTETDGVPNMSFDIVGSTGNIYETVIGRMPYCTCPDSTKGNQCKHICYVLVNALKAPEHLQYQLAFLSTELRQIYEGSPLSRAKSESQDEENTNGNRKPIEGDCPICFMEFEPDKENIVWCRARCGNNIHKTCFQQWAATQRMRGVTCVYCRSPWEYEKEANLDVQGLMSRGSINEEGYVNVAGQLGLCGIRDHSTYSPWLDYRSSYNYYRRRTNLW